MLSELTLHISLMEILIFAIQCFAEEMYTRGWTMTYFSKRHSIFFAIIVNAIIFLLPHLSNPGIDLLSIANIFIVAIFYAVLFLRFDNIWVCGGAHTAWNFAQGVIFGFNVSGISTPVLLKCGQVGHNIINGGAFGPESSLIATVVVIISLIIAVYYPKKIMCFFVNILFYNFLIFFLFCVSMKVKGSLWLLIGDSHDFKWVTLRCHEH